MADAVLDASAVLTALTGGEGAEAARGHLAGALVSAVNYAEVLARAARLCGSFAEARRRVDRHRLRVVPFDADQAAGAALIASSVPAGLPLAAQACLALGLTRGAEVMTADREWGAWDVGVRVVCIR